MADRPGEEAWIAHMNSLINASSRRDPVTAMPLDDQEMSALNVGERVGPAPVREDGGPDEPPGFGDRLPPEMEADLEAQRAHEEAYRETLRAVVKTTDHSYACNYPRQGMACYPGCDCACHRECPDLLKAEDAFDQDPMTAATGMGSEMAGEVYRAHVRRHGCQGYGVDWP